MVALTRLLIFISVDLVTAFLAHISVLMNLQRSSLIWDSQDAQIGAMDVLSRRIE
jgi:hypothetical protein